MDRVKKLYRNILFSTVIIGLVSTALFELAPRAVVGLFGVPTNIPNPADYWEFGEMTFRIFLSLVTFTCIIKMSSIFFQAVGKPMRAIAASMIRDIICFIPLIILLPRFFDIGGILFAAPIADLIAVLVTCLLTVTFLRSLKTDPGAAGSKASIQKSHSGVIITIAREHGSSGKQIGKVVAKKLGIPFYYKEVTALAAQESGLDQGFISEINQDSPARLHRLYLSTEVVRQAVIAQEQILQKIAENGSCVIVGRAADYVLRNRPNVLRVFVYAPQTYRIKRLEEIYGDTEEEAKKNLLRSDAARASYYKQISGNHWGDYGNFHLLIDSSIGVDATAEILVNYTKHHPVPQR